MSSRTSSCATASYVSKASKVGRNLGAPRSPQACARPPGVGADSWATRVPCDDTVVQIDGTTGSAVAVACGLHAKRGQHAGSFLWRRTCRKHRLLRTVTRGARYPSNQEPVSPLLGSVSALHGRGCSICADPSGRCEESAICRPRLAYRGVAEGRWMPVPELR